MTDLVPILGGIGLFLLGMTILTEGLKGLAGGALRRALARYTTSPVTGAAVGAATTAVIQSSSATTVTVVGFVGAGLLTFPQALGVIFGANIGTTVTGWLVALLGFKLHLGAITLPLIFIGVLMRLFASQKLREIGWALAGFGLLFLGIDALQDGMAPFEGAVTPDSFPPDSFLGRLQLVGLGIVITLITQSSSAGIAVALTALSAGAISFPQAAAMAIGMDVGTTFTAALATLGGATATRRTGYAHVVYNLMTGILALFLLDPFFLAASALIEGGPAAEPQLALVAFHTTFNALGVLIALPFTTRFAHFIERLTPETGPPLLRHLDERLLKTPESALDAATATLALIAERLSGSLANRLRAGPPRRDFESGQGVADALDATLAYLGRVPPSPATAPTHARHVAVLHALDHLVRLSARAAQRDRIASLRAHARLNRLGGVLCSGAETLHAALGNGEDLDSAEARLERIHDLMRRQNRIFRRRIVDLGARRPDAIEQRMALLDAMRWLHRSADHLWSVARYLDDSLQDRPRPQKPAVVTVAPEAETNS